MSITDRIAARLNERRPDRYINKSWINDVADSIPLDASEFEALARQYLRAQAKEIENGLTKTGNQIARDYARTGQEPLSWEIVGNVPISIMNTVIENGEPKRFRERVKLSAATSKDLQLWAQTERAAAERDYATRMETVAGIELWERKLRTTKARTWGEYQKRNHKDAA
ncbi:hypothetical protein [Corynebacterium ulceribovis]|uniref:hypothetical protein n=1 Tax=Corynebacterium ulceribovis TaxID=487732 RepID=UPI00036A8205|nr:hypothetical protein [Corynebacterium ulceribovis]